MSAIQRPPLTELSAVGPSTGAPDQLDHAPPEAGAPRHSRRLSDKILVAFHHACDQRELAVAEQLLQIVETMLLRPGLPADGTRRRSLDSLVAAHERLWHLRNEPRA